MSTNPLPDPVQDDPVDAFTKDALGMLPAAPAALQAPQPPPSMRPEQAAAYQEQARAVATGLAEARGSREMELADSVSNLGAQAQRQAGAELALLRGRVGDMLAQEGAGSKIAEDLIELRTALLQIDPNALSKQNPLQRALGSFGVGRSSPLQVLERISARYEATAAQVQIVEMRLNDGRRMLARDNIELRKLYEGVEAQQASIAQNIYLGELLMQELTALKDRTADPLKREGIQNALHDVAMRVQDLRAVETVHQQFFVGIEMTRQNNRRLAQAVERTVSMAANVITVGLAIQSALARQKRVLEATQQSQQFLGDMLAANAAAINQHTKEIGDIYNQPVVALDKITQAQRDLLQAMDTVGRLKEEGIQSARRNIATMAQMTAEMQGKLGGLQTGIATERPPLET
jgi:uncharacterized protein YaaN involved in tellurite resistance